MNEHGGVNDTHPTERGRRHCSVQTTESGSHPALLGQGLRSHAIPKANKQLLRAYDGRRAVNMACQRSNWAKQMQFCLYFFFISFTMLVKLNEFDFGSRCSHKMNPTTELWSIEPI